MRQTGFFDDEHERDMATKQGLPYQRGSDTSKAAAESMEEVAPAILTQVLLFIKRSGKHGANYDEIVVALNRDKPTISARCNELKRLGKIVDSGKRRMTRSGRPAAVYLAKEVASGEGEMGQE